MEHRNRLSGEFPPLEVPFATLQAYRNSTGYFNGTARSEKSRTKRSTAAVTNGFGNTKTGADRFDARFKVLMLGNSGVGKTSIIRSLMGEKFNPGTISTIGIDLAKKIFTVDNNRIQLEVWDTAGQEQYYSIVALHFREAKGFIVVYDVTDPKSFEQIPKYWLRSVDQHMDEPVPVFFAANKADLATMRGVTSEQGEQLAAQQYAHGYFETSAKSGHNIQNLFQHVAESMVSTWGAPKRFYELESNGDAGPRWPNQFTRQPTFRLTEPPKLPPKQHCCNGK
ncbi:unnamed protein product [Calicophoron daubneyi]|uniref:Uncharacterized protein n=1 Tax=Calicophoron daubneyi TaxID=300641 RepID=A0AAV2TE83_CALDB